MQQIDPTIAIRPTLEAKGYLTILKNNKAFDRMIDAYLFAAAFAIKHNVDAPMISSQGRQDLVSLSIVDNRVRLALAAGIYVVCQRNGQPKPADGKEVLEMLTQYAETGLKLLKQRWEGKVGIQIQDDVRRILGTM